MSCSRVNFTFSSSISSSSSSGGGLGGGSSSSSSNRSGSSSSSTSSSSSSSSDCGVSSSSSRVSGGGGGGNSSSSSIHSKFVKNLPLVYRFCADYMNCVRCVVKFCIIAKCVTLKTALPTQYADVLMNYYPHRLHITSCNVSSVVVIRLKTNYIYHIVALLFCILQKYYRNKTGNVRIT